MGRILPVGFITTAARASVAPAGAPVSERLCNQEVNAVYSLLVGCQAGEKTHSLDLDHGTTMV